MRWRVRLVTQPNIEENRCNACGTCVNLCRRGVFTLTAGGKAEITHSENCETGCRTCARICPSGAITFADEEEFIAYLNIRLDMVKEALEKIPQLRAEQSQTQNPPLRKETR